MKNLLKKHFFTIFSLGISTALIGSASGIDNIYFEHDGRIPLVYFNILIPMGSAHDPKNQLGLTKLAGEMLLRGTKSKTKTKFDDELEKLGARIDIETRSETTVIRSAFLSEHIRDFLVQIGEVLTAPLLDPAELIKLKRESLSRLLDIKGRDEALARYWWPRVFYGNHPYGNPPMGTIEGLEAIQISHIKSQLGKMLSKNSIRIVGSGDADQSFIKSWFSTLDSKLSNAPPPAALPEFVPNRKRRLVFIDKKDRTQTQILLGQSGVSYDNPDVAPLTIGNAVFGGQSFNSRLMQEVREKRGWSYGANSNFIYSKRPRHWQVYFSPKNQDTLNALALVDSMIQDLGRIGVRREEFDLMKTSLVEKSGFNFNTSLKRVENTLLEISLGLPIGYLKDFYTRIEKTSYEQTNSALKATIKPQELVVMVLGTAAPLKDKIKEVLKLQESDVTIIKP